MVQIQEGQEERLLQQFRGRGVDVEEGQEGGDISDAPEAEVTNAIDYDQHMWNLVDMIKTLSVNTSRIKDI